MGGFIGSPQFIRLFFYQHKDGLLVDLPSANKGDYLELIKKLKKKVNGTTNIQSTVNNFNPTVAEYFSHLQSVVNQVVDQKKDIISLEELQMHFALVQAILQNGKQRSVEIMEREMKRDMERIERERQIERKMEIKMKRDMEMRDTEMEMERQMMWQRMKDMEMKMMEERKMMEQSMEIEMRRRSKDIIPGMKETSQPETQDIERCCCSTQSSHLSSSESSKKKTEQVDPRQERLKQTERQQIKNLKSQICLMEQRLKEKELQIQLIQSQQAKNLKQLQIKHTEQHQLSIRKIGQEFAQQMSSMKKDIIAINLELQKQRRHHEMSQLNSEGLKESIIYEINRLWGDERTILSITLQLKSPLLRAVGATYSFEGSSISQAIIVLSGRYDLAIIINTASSNVYVLHILRQQNQPYAVTACLRS